MLAGKGKLAALQAMDKGGKKPMPAKKGKPMKPKENMGALAAFSGKPKARPRY